jgi:hypothetical protein
VALGYKNELYGPVYIDGDHNSINKLLRHLAKVVGQDVINRFREETLVDDELPALNQIIAWFEESGNFSLIKLTFQYIFMTQEKFLYRFLEV